MNGLRFACGFLFLCAVGCSGLEVPQFSAPDWKLPDWKLTPKGLRSQSPELENLDEEFTETERKTKMVGDYTTITGMNRLVLVGVGLVVGLDGTGGDPAPSTYRTAMLDELRRNNIRSPNQVLASPNTALVVVQAELPPLVRRGQRFDVRVVLPPSSNAESLAGGELYETRLSERAIVPGQGALKGHELAIAKGPVLVSVVDPRDPAGVKQLKRGRVLAGGVAKTDRDMAIYLRHDERSIRTARRIAHGIGKRFYVYNRYGSREPVAVPEDTQRIVLKLKGKYRDNHARYLQVIRNIAFHEDEVARRVRMEDLRDRLNTPRTSEIAAIQLEAIGEEAIPILKTGLKNDVLEVQFHSAVALAYLEDEAGIDVLARAAREEPAFRVFALAAMSVLDHSETHLALRELMKEPSVETRYGAFRALWTLDKYDPFIRGEDMDGQFRLHVLDTLDKDAPDVAPLIHLTHHKHAEVVLFGADQTLSTPLALAAGNHIRINARPGSDKVIVSRYQVGRSDLRRVVSTRVDDVIRAAVELGATYPDVASMLVQAEQQGNAPGEVEIDALPQSGRVYIRPGNGEYAVGNEERVGRKEAGPNMFPMLGEDEEAEVELPEVEAPEAKSETVESNAAPETPVDDEAAPATSDVNQPSVELEAEPNIQGVPVPRKGIGRLFGPSRIFKAQPADVAEGQQDL